MARISCGVGHSKVAPSFSVRPNFFNFLMVLTAWALAYLRASAIANALAWASAMANALAWASASSLILAFLLAMSKILPPSALRKISARFSKLRCWLICAYCSISSSIVLISSSRVRSTCSASIYRSFSKNSVLFFSSARFMPRWRFSCD